MKKFLSLIIALVLTMSVFAVLPVFAEEDVVYNVSTAEQLNEAITAINAMTASSSVVIDLKADIVYNEDWTSEELYTYATTGTVPETKNKAPAVFTPLGSTSSNAFGGTFNGNGHTISGLCVRTNGQGAALIAYGKGTTVNNVTIDRSAFFASGGWVGAIIGNSHGSSAVNNISNVNVTDIKAKSPNMYVGGIVGANYTALNVTNVYVEGHVESTFDPSDSKVYVGGVCGLNSGGNANLILKNAVVEADVSAKGFVGSFLGAGASNGKTSITNAFATGNVTATSQKAGGIVGCVNGAGATTLKNCAFVGTADDKGSSNQEGPIFGYNHNTSVAVDACYGFKKDDTSALTAKVYGGYSGTATVISDVACKTRDELAASIKDWGEAATDTFTNSTVALGALFNNTVVGIQTGYDKVEGEAGRTRAVRFIATIDATDYQEVGFIIKMTRPNGNDGTESVTVEKGTTSVYKSINSVSESTPATEFGSQYLTAIGVNNLDSVSELTFEVSSYVITLDGEKYITDVKTVEYENIEGVIYINGKEEK